VKFIVAQTGGRRGYAVPAILEKAGMLERFYTDLCADAGLGALLSCSASLPFINGSVRRLRGRRLPKEIRPKTTSFAMPGLVRLLRGVTAAGDAATNFRNALRYSIALGDAMARKGFGEATHVYSMLGECGPLLVEARRRGLKVISEIYILLSTERILAEERKKFPGWEDDAPDFAAVRQEFGFNDLPLGPKDFAICPSEAVRDDLVTNYAVASERTAVVPYGMNPDLLEVRNEPVPGRVLFAGTADLRKGIHYLAMAAEQLRSRGFRGEFRVAGDVRPNVARQPVCRQ